MPKRSNEFQRLVKDVYERLMPLGAAVQESAMVVPLGGGPAREVDLLITVPAGTHEAKLAVECRDHERDQTVEWIDSLIGKYTNLPIDKVIAISSSDFSESAKGKAYAHKIELLTLADAVTLDWAKRLIPENQKTILSTHYAVVIGVFMNKNEILNIKISESGEVSGNDLAKSAASALWEIYSSGLQDRIFRLIQDEKVNPQREDIIKNPAPRYIEIETDLRGCLIHKRGGSNIDFDRLIFGIVTRFEISDLTFENKALGDRVISWGQTSVGEHVVEVIRSHEKNATESSNVKLRFR